MARIKWFPCLSFKRNEYNSKSVDFSNNDLSQNFPQIWEYENLEEVHITSAKLTTFPPQFFYCQNLTVLVANNNNIQMLPNAIGALRNLEHLNLSRNSLSDVPISIKSLKNLIHLNLSCNILKRLPEAITSLISLQELMLNETCLEFLPANFGRLSNLRIIELRLNRLESLPKSMTRLINLQRIDIGGNEFQILPSFIGGFKQLRELWIDLSNIRILPNIDMLKDLEHFEASGNFLESLPFDISNWNKIEVLSISFNNMKKFPNIIGQLKYLVTLKCEYNKLTELPDSISFLINLEELVLNHNQLSSLPNSIGMIRKLRYLFLDNNRLKSLPNELSSCVNLTVLSISHNILTELPSNIGHLKKLKVLNLVSNKLISLPSSLLRLDSLNSLWLSENQSQPLVTLQYVDPQIKDKVTCFMLPQAQAFQSNTSKNAITVTAHPLSDIIPNETTKIPETLSPKNISFADESKYLARKSCNIDAENYRLLRSPTPYPKDCRLFNKYLEKYSRHICKSSSDCKIYNSKYKETDDMPNANNKGNYPNNRSPLIQSLCSGIHNDGGKTIFKNVESFYDCGGSFNKDFNEKENTSRANLDIQMESHKGWIFGPHKNPKVKQYTIKWEAEIGFDIAEQPDKDGIYINEITPNTYAEKILRKNDKLLDVNGFDFSNIHLINAKEILRTPSTSLTLMVSRF